MKKRIGCVLTVAGVLLFIGCGGKEGQSTEALVTVQELPINMEAENTSETESVSETENELETEEIIVNGNKGTIRIGTTGTPYTELLTQAKIILANAGWDLQIEVYGDYEKINQDVLDGTLDAHLFAHQTYLNSYNDVNSTELASTADICYEIYGIYSLLNADLTGVVTNVTIGIPREDTKKARALLFLQDLGYITLKDGVGLTAISDDIVENPKNMQFVEYTQDTVSDVLQTTDYCVMGADQVILAGLEPEKDVLKEETPQSESAKAMAALLVTTVDRVEDKKLILVEDAIKSETTKEYVEDAYKGALGLFP